VSRADEPAGWGPEDERRHRAAWLTEPPRLDGPLRLTEYDPAGREAAKRELAARHWAYVQQYADAKTDVIEEILRRSAPG
jgi:hypothetical protein